MTAHTWPAVLDALVTGTDLDAEQTRWALGEVMGGRADDARLAALLVGLRAKGETVEEVAGLAQAMLAHAVDLPVPGPTLDIVGTGGDGARTVNISTMASLVAAAAGARVVKHGNRAASSECGTADVLEELGLDLALEPGDVVDNAERCGITFAFAQRFHPAMRYVGPVRRSLGLRTVFNSLGPLTNPSRPTAMSLGVADARHAPIIAGVLARRGTTALVVRGDDGLDELTTTAPNTVRVVAGGVVVDSGLDASELGLARVDVQALRGGGREANAVVVREVLAGRGERAVVDVVALNAASGLLALDLAAEVDARATEGEPDAAAVVERVAGDLAGALRTPLRRAQEVLASGEADRLLQRWLGR